MAIFYRLDCGDSQFVELSELNDWESITCPLFDGHQRAGRRITKLQVDIVAKQITDFSTTILPYFVISDHALKVLNSAKLTGFRVDPVIVCEIPNSMERDAIPKLWELIATGDGGYASSASRITAKEKCDACGYTRYSAYEYGIEVDEGSYDGSDFFTVREYPSVLLVNEKSRKVIETAGLTGCTFVETSKLEWPKGVVKP